MEDAARALCQHLAAIKNFQMCPGEFSASSSNEDADGDDEDEAPLEGATAMVEESVDNSTLFPLLSARREPPHAKLKKADQRLSLFRRSRLEGLSPDIFTQLNDMGFSPEKIEMAVKAVKPVPIRPGIETPSVSIELLVGWLLDHVNDDQIVSDDDTDSCGSSSVCSSSSSDGTVCSSPDLPFDYQSTYKTRNDFSSDDCYAEYVRDNIAPGMLVRCCESYEKVPKDDIGSVIHLDTGTLHELNAYVEWTLYKGKYYVRFTNLVIIGKPGSSLNSFKEKLRVRLRSKSNRSGLRQQKVGTIISIGPKKRDVVAAFPDERWIGEMGDLEIVKDAEKICHTCSKSFIKGVVNICKCKSCNGRFLFCSNCVKELKKENPNHRFEKRIPGVDLLDNWQACVKLMTVSSMNNSAHRMVDGGSGYWQSHGAQGRHWIRLEIQPFILISRLCMRVDPTDASYMPSLISVSVGQSVNQLKLFRSISVPSDEDLVDLIQDASVYYKIIEIQIKQCRNSGIDCKIHGLSIVGKRRAEEDRAAASVKFLASDEEDEDIRPIVQLPRPNDHRCPARIQTQVYVWGLNDKDQLGGPKGSKIKLPFLHDYLSSLKVADICGGSKSLFAVTHDGRVYACGEATGGRLGLGITSGGVMVPKLLKSLGAYVVKKVAVHSGGRHTMALTIDGKVFSWGEGDDGKLGHFNRTSYDIPRQIEALRSKRIKDIACGSAHSAAISQEGELYTWGLGDYGRLGHGDNSNQLRPKIVASLAQHKGRISFLTM